jgi:hypothetical protein
MSAHLVKELGIADLSPKKAERRLKAGQSEERMRRCFQATH